MIVQLSSVGIAYNGIAAFFNFLVTDLYTPEKLYFCGFICPKAPNLSIFDQVTKNKTSIFCGRL